ncbi:MAG TPA: hypothetical protein VKA68_00720 [bacterium]|nr:hypothetical protein [bacterium]
MRTYLGYPAGKFHTGWLALIHILHHDQPERESPEELPSYQNLLPVESAH